MIELKLAQFYRASGNPIPADLAFSLMEQGINPVTLQTERGSK